MQMSAKTRMLNILIMKTLKLNSGKSLLQIQRSKFPQTKMVKLKAMELIAMRIY